MRLSLPLGDERFTDLLRAWGVPYSFGAGKPSDGLNAWPDGAKGSQRGIGWDCSGLAQAACVRLGTLDSKAIDRTAQSLCSLFKREVARGDEQLGDLAFYGPNFSTIVHVTVVVAPGIILGANGGHSMTNGDDPSAFVRLDRIGYRLDLRTIRRPEREHAPAVAVA